MSPHFSPQPSTAATPMADNRRAQGDKPHDSSRGVSPNPVVRDAPPAATANMTANQMEKMAKSIVIPENMTTDNLQTSPVSLSSFGSVDNPAPTVTAGEPAAAGPLAIEHVPGQDRTTPQSQAKGGDQPGSADGSNRAFTFPGPLPLDQQDPRAPVRNMSLPMTGYAQGSPKSPNTKRHKCPYCSTDFTRHHNLKSHLLTHSQEKPYECPDCHARFRRLHDLKRHTKLHTGERPHICPKCGRRFARGDALARHNKGQGGCAGRRSSYAGDDELGDRGDDTMDGLEYHHGEGDDSRMDDEQGDGSRRVSEPGRRGGQNASQPTAQASYHQHSSTYPPVNQGLASNIRPIYPQGSTGEYSRQNLTSRLGFTDSTPGYLPMPSSTGPGVYAQGGMTESPKPLSPGQQTDQHPGARSPNMTQHVLPQQYSRNGKVTSPIGLPPPPGGANVPQLPSLSGLASSAMGRPSSTKPVAPTAPSMLQHQVPGSNPGSLSSHGGSSGNSIRDLMGNREADVWNYVRDLEARTQRQNEQYEQRIQQLERELTTVKAQLGQQSQAGSAALPAQQQHEQQQSQPVVHP